MLRVHVWGNRVIAAALALSLGCEREPTRSDAEPRQSGAGDRRGGIAMGMALKSGAFSNNGAIPRKFTGEGADVSPELTWSDVSGSARELAMICDDPDAPGPRPWVHWVIYKIPASTTRLPENVEKSEGPPEPSGVLQGKNSWGKPGYGGPMPPPGSGTHHYHFKLYALDATLEAGPGLDKEKLLALMKGHVIAETDLVGTYER